MWLGRILYKYINLQWDFSSRQHIGFHSLCYKQARFWYYMKSIEKAVKPNKNDNN